MENIALIGLVCDKRVRQMISKYLFDFPQESIKKDVIRLTNQIWKLIPMRENEEDWQKQLNTVILEIAGLNEIFIAEPQFLQILSKMEGLKIYEDIDFQSYRKTIFEIISLLQELKNA